MKDDTVSRQAAIDAARKCAVKEVTPAYMLIDKAEVMTELMKLPSAQPEERTEKRTETHACDLISRQAAIDAMAELQGRASSKTELKGISKAWKRIKELPSAQPEIIHCKDCKYFEIAKKTLDGLCRRHRIPMTMYSTGFCSMAERKINAAD